MAESVLQEKSFSFALHIVAAYKKLCAINEYVLSKQMLRSGTSIGANISEANMAQSKADFSSKMYIALNEANETNYWIRLLKESAYMDEATAMELHHECSELIRMLVSTTKTTAPRPTT